MTKTGIIYSPEDGGSQITWDVNRRNGQFCIRRLRITVKDVLEYLASSMSEKEVMQEFPDLCKEDFLSIYEFLAQRGNRALVKSPTPHGTYGGYCNHQCRCDLCTAANTTHMREVRKNKKAELLLFKHSPSI